MNCATSTLLQAVLLLCTTVEWSKANNPIHYKEEKHLKNVRQLTFGGVNAEAYFSFDGQQILFQAINYEQGTKGCDQIFRLHLYEADAKPTMVSNGLGRTTCSFFLADNSHFIYSTTHKNNAEGQCPTTVCNGKEAPEECKRPHAYLWDIFPDYDIVLSDKDGNYKFLTNNTDYDAEAVVSPDGEMIVFTSTRYGDLNLWLMDTRGQIIRQVTKDIGYDGGAFFSPDSKRLVYRAYHPTDEQSIKSYQRLLGRNAVSPSSMEIFTIDIDGENKTQVTNLGMANWAPFFHPDNKKIIFSSNHKTPSTFNLFLVDDNGENLKQITYDSHFDSFPMFSPDGKKLIFISARNNTGTAGNHSMNIFLADWEENGARPIDGSKAIFVKLLIALFTLTWTYNFNFSI